MSYRTVYEIVFVDHIITFHIFMVQILVQFLTKQKFLWQLQDQPPHYSSTNAQS
jgi:hypothetical protein